MFAAMGASNAVQLFGGLPRDKDKLLAALDRLTAEIGEDGLERYRRNLRHL